MVAFLRIHEVLNGHLSRALKVQSASLGSPTATSVEDMYPAIKLVMMTFSV